jgi:general secretion pathway protein D
LRDRQEKIPLLGDIPILGHLFKYRSTEKVKQNLMVFLHPKILRDIETGNTYTGEKYNYLRAQQLVADERGIGLLRDAVPILPELEVFLKGETHRAPPPTDDSGASQ